MNIQITKYHGFTLIELIATIAVIAVIALSAGPELGTFLSRNKLSTQTNNFVSSLNLARSEAAKRAINITVCVSNTAQDDCDVTNWENGWIVFIDVNADGAIDAGETILNVNNEVSGNTTIRSAEHVSSIVYLGDGSTSAGTFKLCDAEAEEHAKAINIMSSGIISIGKDNDADKIVDNYQGNSITCP